MGWEVPEVASEELVAMGEIRVVTERMAVDRVVDKEAILEAAAEAQLVEWGVVRRITRCCTARCGCFQQCQRAER